MEDQPQDEDLKGLKAHLNNLVEAVVKAVVMATQTQELDDVLIIRDELHRLPDYLMCGEGKADVAERINLLIADLQRR